MALRIRRQWQRNTLILPVAVLAIGLTLGTVTAAVAQPVSPTSPSATTTTAAPSPGNDDIGFATLTALLTLLGVVVTGVLTYLGSTKAAKVQLEGVQQSAKAGIEGVQMTAESSISAVLINIRADAATRDLTRLDELALHRRARQEAIIGDLSGALKTLAIVVHSYARSRRVLGDALGTAGETQVADVDTASIECVRLLAQLPRAPWFPLEAWDEVHNAIGNVPTVLRCTGVSQQEVELSTFDAGINASQAKLGEAIDRLEADFLTTIDVRRKQAEGQLSGQEPG